MQKAALYIAAFCIFIYSWVSFYIDKAFLLYNNGYVLRLM